MTSNVLSLVKVNLKQSLDFRSLKKSKAKAGTLIGFLVFMGLIFLAVSSLYSFSLGMILKETNMPLIISALIMGGVASLIVLTTSIMAVKQIFIARDFELLSAMPIKKSEIITAKIINLCIVEALYASIIILPNLIINTIISKNLIYILIGLLLLVGVEAFPIIIASIIGSLLAIISARFKHSNLIIIFFSVIAFILIFSLSFLFSTVKSDEEFSNLLNMISGSIIYINPSLSLLNLGFNNPVYFIFYLIAIIFSYILVILFISVFFKQIHSLSRVHLNSASYDIGDLKNKSDLNNLLNIEFKRLFSSKMYFLNSAVGGIISIVFALIFSFNLRPLKNEENGMEIYKLVSLFLPLFIVLFSSFGVSTASAISMEGKSFWLAKTLPLDYKSYLNSKLIPCLIILGIPNIISSVIISIFFEASIFNAIVILLLPLSYLVLLSVVGLRVNLAYPKLSWNDEREVIKHGASAGITCLLDFLFVILIGLLMFGLMFINIYLATILPIVLISIAALIVYLLMLKNSAKLISKIE